MQTGDGLLARLRPVSGAFSTIQLLALAEAAERFGNGILEITSRGSVQVRGLADATIRPFADAVRDAGIVAASGLGIEISPVAGLHPGEKADPRPVADAIRPLCADLAPSLAPKFTLVVDGGVAGLTSTLADLRLTASNAEDWALEIGGRQAGVFPAMSVAPIVRSLLLSLAAMGPAARGRDLKADTMPAGIHLGAPVQQAPDTPAIGPMQLATGTALGLGLPFGQITAQALTALTRLADALGAADLRPAPHHVLLVTGLDRHDALRRQAGDLGLIINPFDKRGAVAACPGSPRCAAGHLPAQTVAEALLAVAPELFDGIDLHVSGCSKRCAHPRPAAIEVIGREAGIEVIFRGFLLALLPEEEIYAAFTRLDALCRDNRQAGETAESVLARLDRAQLSAALLPEP